MPEFRWILLGLGIVLLAGIWWWGARRSRQAPGDAQLRESTAVALTPLQPMTTHTDTAAAADSSEWGVPPFEPLSIRTADFDNIPPMNLSMTAHSEPFDDTLDLSVDAPLPQSPRPPPAPHPATPQSPVAQRAAAQPATPRPATPMPAAPVPPRLASARVASAAVPMATVTAPALEYSDRFSSVEAEDPNTSEQQRIVSVRVCALEEEPWQGADLMAVLEDHGLAHGRYQVFHRKHSDGRTLFCAASLIEPGTFDLARMPEEQFRGLTLFAVLPGPAEPLQTIDALISTAEDLAQALQGTVQITKGVPLSAHGVATLREDVARFQASMTG